jgi:hypothetical protein
MSSTIYFILRSEALENCRVERGAVTECSGTATHMTGMAGLLICNQEGVFQDR